MIELQRQKRREMMKIKREREVLKQKIILSIFTVGILFIGFFSINLPASAQSEVQAITVEKISLPIESLKEEQVLPQPVIIVEEKIEKEIINEVEESLDETTASYIYDVTEEEILLFKQIMAAESCRDWKYDEILSLATVVINRYESETFIDNDSFYEIFTSELQFATYSNGSYLTAEITEACDKAVEDALRGERNLNSEVMYFCTKEYYDVCSSENFFKRNLDEPVYQVRNVLFFEEP